MKILISNAIWGAEYRSTFTNLSLASLLSANNLPRLSSKAQITVHIVTTAADRKSLLRDLAIVRLLQVATIEWEVLEDYGIYSPPTGAGGAKYPFLSALQNLSITRSANHDAIIFNYADFVWADGSLTEAADMLLRGDTPPDAVLGFCMPVDRDGGAEALQRYRGPDGTIDISPRNAAKLIVQNRHREVKNRFWDAHRFTNLPTYMAWRVADQGILLRAYHQSVLAMRVRRDDPEYFDGIVRGSLDAYLTAQLARNRQVVCANDTDKVLVFSLYHTPVDSRLPPGETREMSIKSMLQSDVIVEQRRFAEYPYFLKLRDGDSALWQGAAEGSWRILQKAHDETKFEQTWYDENYETHGLIPKLSRRARWQRWTSMFPRTFARAQAGAVRLYDHMIPHGSFQSRVIQVLREPSQLRKSRRLHGFWTIYDLVKGRFFSSGNSRPAADWSRLTRGQLFLLRQFWFLVRFPAIFQRVFRRSLKHVLGSSTGYELVPNLWIQFEASQSLGAALTVEDSVSRANDDAEFTAGLRQGEALLNKVISEVPVWPTPRRALGRNLWFQGRFEEALQTLDGAERMRDVMAWIAGVPTDECVFLPRNCAESIGLMGHLDAFVKHKILTADPRPYYLLAPRRNIVNPAFLDYWKEHIKIKSNPDEIKRLGAQEQIYGTDWNWAMPQNGKTVFVHKAMSTIQKNWRQAGRPPLLQLSDEHAEKLAAFKLKWSMPEKDKFICLHIRSAGFYGESREHAQRFRNTSVEDYYALIRSLTEMGYWVIRMGDRGMQSLDLKKCGTAPLIIDYALSDDKSPDLDVAICARCELFISSPSGLHTVAHAFGRPVCEVNFPMYAGFPWHQEDIIAPQLYYSRKKDRVLTLKEILGSTIVYLDHHFLLDREEISLLPLEPDDLIETAREALSPSDYHVADPAAADRVAREFDELNRQFDHCISGRLGRYFSAKYATKLLQV